MLLSFFRINDPYRLLGTLFIIVLVSVPFLWSMEGYTIGELKSLVVGEAVADGKLMYAEIFDNTPPLASAVFGFFDLLFGRSTIARHITALVIIFFQAAFFGILLINNKAYTENTYLPSLIFALLCFFSFDALTTSAELLGATVLLLALNNLFKEIEFKIQRDELVLNLGFYLGITTLFVFSYWVFLPTALVLLFVYGRMSARKVGLLFFGFLLPHLILITLYYYWGELTWLYQGFYGAHISFQVAEQLIAPTSLLVLSAVPLAYLFFSFVMLNRQARLTKYQSQLLQVMFWWLLGGLVVVWLSPQRTPVTLSIFFPPIAYFISYYLLLIRRRWRAEIMLWVFVISLISISLLSMYGRLESVDYSKLYQPASTRPIENKRVMVLGEDWSMYEKNQLGGFFLNWSQSQSVLTNLDVYQNVEKVAQCFEQDPPDVIIDEIEAMPNVLARIPKLRSAYVRNGNEYRKINN